MDEEMAKAFDFMVDRLTRTLLTGADLTLAYGRRYCLIGRNGIGKTTLLKMISRFERIRLNCALEQAV